MYVARDRIWHFPNNMVENGIRKHIVDEEKNGIIYVDNYTLCFPVSDHIFCRKENAERAEALLNAIRDIEAVDDERHALDVKEAYEYKAETQNRIIGVMDVITEDLGKEPVRFDRDAFEGFCRLSMRDPKWGVLNLGSVQVVASATNRDVYYPVTRDACGCPNWYFKLRKIGGRCKHMNMFFPEL